MLLCLLGLGGTALGTYIGIKVLQTVDFLYDPLLDHAYPEPPKQSRPYQAPPSADSVDGLGMYNRVE